MHEKTSAASYSFAAVILWLGQVDWSTLSMIIGIILGIGTFIINWYYKRKNTRIYEEAVKRGYFNEPKE